MSEHASTPPRESLAQRRVGVKVQYIKDRSFEVPRAPDIYVAPRAQPRMTLRLNVSSRPIGGLDQTHEVTLTLRVEATDPDATTDAATPSSVEYIAELSYAGLFTLDQVPADAVQEALLVECPHILYPFACNILADLTRDANFQPVALQAVDFMQIWQNKPAQSGQG
jgi:preprotein translocase subunit SecB